MTSTNMNGLGNFYVYSDDPYGEWSEPIRVDIGGIDPSMEFIDGKVYYTTYQGERSSRQGISQVEIDIETGELLSDIDFIWEGTGGKAIEAPHLYKIGEYYYLIVAEGGTMFTHMVTIGRSRSPWGPFESCPYNPILTNMQSRDLDIHCTGHGDLIEDHRGNWWMVFLGIRIARKYMSHIGRETFITLVEWNEEKWPVVNYGKCISIITEGPTLPEYVAKREAERDDFNKNQLELCWNYLRNPDCSNYSLDYKYGCMTLWGSSISIDMLDSPSLLARRQRYFDCEISTSMDFHPSNDGEEAGIIIFLSNEFYYKLVKRKIENEYYLCLEKRAEHFYQAADHIKIKDETISLHIKADKLKYEFYYSITDEEMQLIGSASTRFLSSEVGARSFTGTYVGMYASNKGFQGSSQHPLITSN